MFCNDWGKKFTARWSFISNSPAGTSETSRGKLSASISGSYDEDLDEADDAADDVNDDEGFALEVDGSSYITSSTFWILSAF